MHGLESYRAREALLATHIANFLFMDDKIYKLNLEEINLDLLRLIWHLEYDYTNCVSCIWNMMQFFFLNQFIILKYLLIFFILKTFLIVFFKLCFSCQCNSSSVHQSVTVWWENMACVIWRKVQEKTKSFQHIFLPNIFSQIFSEILFF